MLSIDREVLKDVCCVVSRTKRMYIGPQAHCSSRQSVHQWEGRHLLIHTQVKELMTEAKASKC